MNIRNIAIIVFMALVFCTVCSAQEESQTMIERKTYGNLAEPVGPYSHAVRHGNVLYLSGLTAYGTQARGKGISEQTKAIFEQIKMIAEAEGTDLSSIIKVTIFIMDFEQARELRKELFLQYNGQLPASSLVEVNKLFSSEISIEIEAILGL